MTGRLSIPEALPCLPPQTLHLIILFLSMASILFNSSLTADKLVRIQLRRLYLFIPVLFLILLLPAFVLQSQQPFWTEQTLFPATLLHGNGILANRLLRLIFQYCKILPIPI